MNTLRHGIDARLSWSAEIYSDFESKNKKSKSKERKFGVREIEIGVKGRGDNIIENICFSQP